MKKEAAKLISKFILLAILIGQLGCSDTSSLNISGALSNTFFHSLVSK
jgi:hypothetical protein